MDLNGCVCRVLYRKALEGGITKIISSFGSTGSFSNIEYSMMMNGFFVKDVFDEVKVFVDAQANNPLLLLEEIFGILKLRAGPITFGRFLLSKTGSSLFLKVLGVK